MAPRSRLEPLARAVLRTQPDDRLVALAREGREPAFEEIVRRYRPGLVAFAAAYAPRDRAEDVVQESLVRSWEVLQTTESEIHLRPWLYTIVRNRALNARRDTRIHEPLDEEIDGVRQPAEVALTNEELAHVVAAVRSLPDAQREALVRSSLEGRTHEQIAAALETSPGAVRQLIFRARASVRHVVGLLLPLPLVRALAELGGGDIASAAAGGGAVVAGSVGAGGSSIAVKAVTVAAVGAAIAGSGVAIERASDSNSSANGAQNEALDRDDAGTSLGETPASGTGSSSGSDGDSGPGSSSGPGGGSEGDGDRDEGSEGPGDGDETDADSSGPGGGHPDVDEVEPNDEIDNSGPGSTSSGSGSSGSDSDNSGSGSDNSGSGSGSSGSGSSGSGSGSSGSSGSGSGTSGSGSGSSGSGSGTSGSGSGTSDLDSDTSDSGSGTSGSGSGDSGSGSSGSGDSDLDSSGSGSAGSVLEPDEPALD